MTKGELIEKLWPYTDDIEIELLDYQGMEVHIKHAAYKHDKTEGGKILMVPMGSTFKG